jgi:hypothetical protein
MSEVEDLIRELSEYWNDVYIVYREDKDSWIIRDHTDEMLGGEGYRVRCDELKSGLKKAIENPKTREI